MSLKTCSACPISTAISPASIRPGPPSSAGARTKSRGCMSASCGIPTTRRIRWPVAGGSPRVFQPSAWRTAFATRTARGAGLAWTMTVENGLIYLIGRHVTAEKLAAEALRESERQFRLFTEAATDYALIRLDAQGVVSGWNAGAQRIRGLCRTRNRRPTFLAFLYRGGSGRGCSRTRSRGGRDLGNLSNTTAGVFARMDLCF